ncbi:aminoglycoside 6-adenylyltransferase [Tetragenococcus solitarius]|uniref:Aminoglycoside 6-adenylyltransferase n=1 Tax=Tetragenococcus solitarius TaxID=71453 RepID=A0ABN3YCV2_9ENTE|nr:aminoglycoside 6-adenylyltransferase [Tetragenococcus solitarius]
MDKTMQRLTNFFETNDDLKVFAMNGSKLDKNIPDDKFKDFDVVFFTDCIEKYKKDRTFLNIFGEILLLTEPDGEGYVGKLTFPEKDGYIFLVQFENGIRIDMQFLQLKKLEEYLTEDSLTKIIGDKDARIKMDVVPNDSDYWQVKPKANEIEYSVKEFWWQFNNTLKATLRNEFLLAQFYLNLTREELFRLITWFLSFEHGFDKNYGKQNHKIIVLLSEDVRKKIYKTFETSSTEQLLVSLKAIGELELTFLVELYKYMDSDFMTKLIELKSVPIKFLNSKGEGESAEYFKTAFESDSSFSNS